MNPKMPNKLSVKSIGVLGAGKVGIVIAQLALKAGYTVYVAGSGSADKIALTVKILAPGAHAVTNREAIEKSDLAILALPLSKYRSIPSDAFKNTLIIDAMNHWYEVDGPREDTVPSNSSSSEIVQAYLQNARVVKALSHMGYHELHDGPKQKGDPARKAIAIAGDFERDWNIVAEVIDSLGFDPLIIGSLGAGKQLEPGAPAFGANLPVNDLRALIPNTQN